MSVTNAMRAAAMLVCLAAMMGCSNAPDRQVTPGTIGKAIFKGRPPATPPSAAQIAADVTSALAATDAPLILLAVPERKAVTVMQRLEHNRGYETFGTADRRSVTLHGGMLTGTRGLGHDLMSSEVEAVRALVSARRPGEARRVMRHLDGEGLIAVQIYTCSVRTGDTSRMKIAGGEMPVTQVNETCAGGGTGFENTYQVTSNGRIVQSRQWHSPLLGHVTIRSLR